MKSRFTVVEYMFNVVKDIFNVGKYMSTVVE